MALPHDAPSQDQDVILFPVSWLHLGAGAVTSNALEKLCMHPTSKLLNSPVRSGDPRKADHRRRPQGGADGGSEKLMARRDRSFHLAQRVFAGRASEICICALKNLKLHGSWPDPMNEETSCERSGLVRNFALPGSCLPRY